jgi:hypothetical protein
MCKMSLSSSAWQTSAPRLQKGATIIHSLPQRQGKLASLMQVPLLSSKKNKKKASSKDKPLAGAPTIVAAVAGGSRGPCGDKRPCQLSDSDEGGSRCTTPSAIMSRSARRSRSLQISSMSNRSYNRATMTHLPSSKRVSSRLPRRATRMRRWHSRMPKARSRPSMATLTLTPAPMSTARRSVSCTVAPRTSRPGASSRLCVGRSQQLHLHQGQHPTTS